MNATTTPLLKISDLRIGFAPARNKSPNPMIIAVDGVSLTIPRGKTVALVGESGCGKSVTALSIARLLPTPPAQILTGHICLFDSTSPTNDESPIDLLSLPERDLRHIRGRRIAMIFQDPLTSLNPVYSVGDQIIEAILLHRYQRKSPKSALGTPSPSQGERRGEGAKTPRWTNRFFKHLLRRRDARREAIALLRRVGIPAADRRVDDYPHQLSGGMRQRVMIAMALACRPSLLIADEPTTALDVTIQAEILQLLRDLQSETGMSILLITHDFGVVAAIAHKVYVMYAGRIVEHASMTDVLTHPLHPYTQGLLRCTPRLTSRSDRLEVIPGHVPHPSEPISGCRFHPRCPLTIERAADHHRWSTWIPSDIGGTRVLRRCIERFDLEPSGQPELRETTPGHWLACWEAG